ncbi:hypothetical protein PP564_00180 [Mycobacteroides abscessus]|uniref:Integral membrane protein n=1 Tax=Mycobacteroides abscessus 21 TaxID=1299324 RepID=A0A829QC29_9MYCO|nr:hypothetical protein [Mycobacteroides abscessus]EUA49654.1 hypothetical protein I543_4483 [Mycobacteroides abscessus 21]EIC71313.1 hypothetical protein S7W_00810 [Mycobacteroides abscessus M94]MBE5496211.1 hypothetical protein [Mycobacteroides abscessus]MBN7457812.1 hypothetical protein [Mycobacteroides abscessus subsp. abscessus]MBN7545157.1 hypothetical protein [Mycobacteroides abscessus subsp. abscessus]
MRFLFAALLWLLTTAALAVTIAAAWAQSRLVDENGYAALTAPAAADPRVQHAIAGELTTQIVSLGKKQGSRVDESQVAELVASYTSGPRFEADFGSVNRMAHQWLFTNSSSAQRDSQGGWQIDIAPMIKSLAPQGLSIKAPETLKVSVTDDKLAGLTPGRLVPVARFGQLAVWIFFGLTLVLAGLTQLAVRSRAKGLAGLGISALLVGAAGWAGLEIGRSYLDRPLSRVTGNVRDVADSLVTAAVGNAHHWLSLTMAAGGLVIVIGVVSGLLGALLRR